MATAKDIMHPGAQWISREETLDRAAQLMRDLDVGALPVSDENQRLCGIITDRDIVVKCVALSLRPLAHPPAPTSARARPAGSTPAPTSARSCTRWRAAASAACRWSRTSGLSA